MDEIKKNRALDEQEEKFSFRDKKFTINYLDKANNHSIKGYYNNNYDNNNEIQKNIDHKIEKDHVFSTDEINEKVYLLDRYNFFKFSI